MNLETYREKGVTQVGIPQSVATCNRNADGLGTLAVTGFWSEDWVKESKANSRQSVTNGIVTHALGLE